MAVANGAKRRKRRVVPIYVIVCNVATAAFSDELVSVTYETGNVDDVMRVEFLLSPAGPIPPLKTVRNELPYAPRGDMGKS